jgi:acyl carrier protein
MTTLDDEVTAFLLARRPELTELAPDLDLVEAQVIDSLGFMALLVLLEDRTGRTIDLDTVTRDDFRTLARIRERFLTQPPNGRV